MDIGTISKSIAELGYGAIALSAVLVASWKLLTWGKSIVDTAMGQLETERVRSTETYRKLASAIDEHTAQAKEFHGEVRNAHQYQREEHMKILDISGSVCSN